MDAFAVEFSEIAAEHFRKLDPVIRKRIVRKLDQVAKDPDRFLSRLSSIDSYKLRIGDYRLILDMERERPTLFVLTLGHRKTIYDRA